MQHQEELLKWLNGDMNAEELAAFKQTQTYKEYHKIAAYASRLKPDTLDKQAAYKSFKTKITQNWHTPTLAMRKRKLSQRGTLECAKWSSVRFGK